MLHHVSWWWRGIWFRLWWFVFKTLLNQEAKEGIVCEKMSTHIQLMRERLKEEHFSGIDKWYHYPFILLVSVYRLCAKTGLMQRQLSLSLSLSRDFFWLVFFIEKQRQPIIQQLLLCCAIMRYLTWLYDHHHNHHRNAVKRWGDRDFGVCSSQGFSIVIYCGVNLHTWARDYTEPCHRVRVSGLFHEDKGLI